jgi:hypothetical protein
MQEQRHLPLRVLRLRQTRSGCKPAQLACTAANFRSPFLSATNHYAVNLLQMRPLRAFAVARRLFDRQDEAFGAGVGGAGGLAANSSATHRLLPSRGDVSECKHFMELTTGG